MKKWFNSSKCRFVFQYLCELSLQTDPITLHDRWMACIEEKCFAGLFFTNQSKTFETVNRDSLPSNQSKDRMALPHRGFLSFSGVIEMEAHLFSQENYIVDVRLASKYASGTPSQMFDWVLNTPLALHCFTYTYVRLKNAKKCSGDNPQFFESFFKCYADLKIFTPNIRITGGFRTFSRGVKLDHQPERGEYAPVSVYVYIKLLCIWIPLVAWLFLVILIVVSSCYTFFNCELYTEILRCGNLFFRTENKMTN